MSERCTNCGSELFAGQQFCRRCGAVVRQAGDERPTQILEGGTVAAGAQGGAVRREGGAGTDPFAAPRPTAAQEPFRAFQQTAPLAPAFPRGGRAKWWAIPFVLIVALACLGLLLVNRTHQTPERIVIKRGGLSVTGAVVPPLPPIPPETHEEARKALEDAGAPVPFDESSATVTGEQTVLTETFELGEDVTFSIPDARGDVAVEGWDGDEAEIKIIKRGGSAEERRAVPVMLARGDERVSLMSPRAARTAGSHGVPGSGVGVSYEIKLPRTLRQLEITSEASRVKLRNLSGTVVVDVKAGSVELRDVSGIVRSKLIKGDTKVTFERATHDGAQEFSVVRGNVEVDFAEEPSTDIKAETMDGDISADDSLGLRLVKSPAGRHALGRLGEGGDPLLIKVVNGDIRLRK